ncbi:hypothetical protein Tco_0329817, partial [Tanacetum coccineum]
TSVAERRGTCNSRKRLRTQAVSATALATPRYSASVLEREVTCCRLEDHEMRLSPRKTQYPEVEHLVEGHPAQSASEYAMSCDVGDAYN